MNDGANKPHALAESLAGAAQVVAQVMGGASLAHASPSFDASNLAGSRLRAAVQDLAYTTLRAYGVPQTLTRTLLHRPVPDPVLLALIYVALVDLRERPDRAYVIVDEAVDAARRLGRTAAKGLVNAVLRSYLRLRQDLESKLAADPVARYRHPPWWIAQVKRTFPQGWEAALAASNAPPPMTLRVNARKRSTDQYADELGAAGMAATRVGEHALLLEKPVSVERLPGFHEGHVSVQDEGAQRAAALLDVQPGQRVLDACAAPGGKAAHVLERTDCALTALDVDPLRAARIDENFRRLRLRGRVLVGDAAAPEGWYDGKRFDRILADVPCTASGVVRRHPDIKWLRRQSDIERFAAAQAAILEALWRVLEPGGRLLYVTCSIFGPENGGRIDAFLDRNRDARRLETAGIPDGQLAPTAIHDGFFYALLEKG